MWSLYVFIKLLRLSTNFPDLNQINLCQTLFWLSWKNTHLLSLSLPVIGSFAVFWTELIWEITLADLITVIFVQVSVILYQLYGFVSWTLIYWVESTPDPGTWLWEMQKSFSWLNVSPGFQGHSRWKAVIPHLFFLLFLYFVIIIVKTVGGAFTSKDY